VTVRPSKLAITSPSSVAVRARSFAHFRPWFVRLAEFRLWCLLAPVIASSKTLNRSTESSRGYGCRR
jgi:hypothetical protein